MAREILRAISECEKLMRHVNRTEGLARGMRTRLPPTRSIEKFEIWGCDPALGKRDRLTDVMGKLTDHWALKQIALSRSPPFFTFYPHVPGSGPIIPKKLRRRFLEMDVQGAQQALQRRGYLLKPTTV
ncbi:MAG: hypothetical protein Q8R15_03510, partial [Candidatus Micrarchaeota archaeon]|nr:hypothetical protein [Candidatus Micrarchaeota archaeon]